MFSFNLVLLTLSAVTAAPSQLLSYMPAVDTTAAVSLSTFNCLKTSGVYILGARAYKPDNNGSFDSNIVYSADNAYTANANLVPYMEPQPLSNIKDGNAQFLEMFNGFRNNGVGLRSFYLKVIGYKNWHTSYSANIKFINDVVTAAKRQSVSVNFLTNQHDWTSVTNNIKNLTDSSLWYTNVKSQGISGETPADFADFKAFGSWSFASAKQYGQQESLCGLVVNKDVFLGNGSPTEFFEKLEKN